MIQRYKIKIKQTAVISSGLFTAIIRDATCTLYACSGRFFSSLLVFSICSYRALARYLIPGKVSCVRSAMKSPGCLSVLPPDFAKQHCNITGTGAVSSCWSPVFDGQEQVIFFFVGFKTFRSIIGCGSWYARLTATVIQFKFTRIQVCTEHEILCRSVILDLYLHNVSVWLTP